MDTSEIISGVENHSIDAKTKKEEIDLRYLKSYVEKITNEDIALVAEAVAKIAEFLTLNKYDYAIFTGSSRILLKAIFQGVDLGDTKIISLNPEENKDIYNRKEGDSSLIGFSDDSFYSDRSTLMESVLKQKGVILEGAKIAVVDDHVDNGFKARDYIEIMSRLKDIRDFKFIVPLANENDFVNETIGQNKLSHYWVVKNTNKLFTFMGVLSDALRVTDPERHTETNASFSPEGQKLLRNTVRETIKLIRKNINDLRNN